jgi:hypothetical protein
MAAFGIAATKESAMVGRKILATACVLAVSVGACGLASAQSNSPQSNPAPINASDGSVTVLTMAPGGAWGAATDISTNRAIARAIANCKAMSQETIGCGAYYTTIRAGWSLGIRCGRETIVVAANDLLEAEQAAANRERQLRQVYVPNMPACVRIVTVDPRGAIIAPQIVGDNAGPTGDTITHQVKTSQSSPSIAKAAGDIPVWKTITLGTYKDVNMLREDLDSLHCGLAAPARGAREQTQFVPGTMTPLHCALGESAAEIIGRPAFALNRTRSNVDLVVLSAPELGFEGERVAVADIYARAKQLGLELCAAEVGAQLRLQYLDQPLGEFLRIAMEPIATYAGDLVDLTVANGGASLALVGSPAQSDAIVHPSVRFVFVRPTQVARRTAS